MKKYLVPLATTAIIMTLVLAACGAKSPTASTAGTSSTTGSTGSNGFTFNPTTGTSNGASNSSRPLPLAEQLVVGTFKLEGTPNAIDAKTAAALIPLWQAYAQLSTSNTAAQAEIDSVVSQIQTTMTTQQVQAITGMKLTRQDMTTTMTTLGLTNNFQANAQGTPNPNRTTRGTGGGFNRTFGRGGTGGAGGGFTGGGGFGGGTGTNGTRPTPNATQQALRTQFANRIPSNLMNALISLLQKRAGV